MGLKGAEALGKMLARNQTLLVLRLDNNPLKDTGNGGPLTMSVSFRVILSPQNPVFVELEITTSGFPSYITRTEERLNVLVVIHAPQGCQMTPEALGCGPNRSLNRFFNRVIYRYVYIYIPSSRE